MHNHIGERLFSYSVKCLKQGRWKDAFSLMRQAVPYGLVWNLKRVAATLTGAVFRGLALAKKTAADPASGERNVRKFFFTSMS